MVSLDSEIDLHLKDIKQIMDHHGRPGGISQENLNLYESRGWVTRSTHGGKVLYHVQGDISQYVIEELKRKLFK